jgi:SHS family sialic acid transporter-like MFS transporter
VSQAAASLSPSGRKVILVVAFLGWFFCGFHMQITQLAGRPAAIDLLAASGQLDAERFLELSKVANKRRWSARITEADEQYKDWEALVGRWAAWFQCAFLFGAAAGGLCFGRLGDWIGRSKAMAISIVTYSALAAVAPLAQSPVQFWILWFLACMGVGGMWPNGVALLSEAWSNLSRPVVAGVIGTAANIGILLFATLATYVAIKPDDWRWAPLAGSCPLLLGLLAWFIVPESPRWLATRVPVPTDEKSAVDAKSSSLLGITIVAIVLATVPIIGGWGVSNWMNPWADQEGARLDLPDPYLKARLGQARAFTGIIGSLLGGWIATIVGRRLTYFLVSVFSLGIASYMYTMLTPTHPWFLTWVSILGFVSGIYFGWLPLCLPELFPTHYRATGAGIGFNFGRIVTAVMLFVSGALMAFFNSDYPTIGRYTSLCFLLGMVFIWAVPDSSKNQLQD